jgi:hypothetical protein
MDFYWFFSEKPPGNRPSRKGAVLMAKKKRVFYGPLLIFLRLPLFSRQMMDINQRRLLALM